MTAVAFFCMCQRGHFQRLRPIVSALAARGIASHVFTDRRLAADVLACGGRFEDLFDRHSLGEADDTSIPPPFRYVSFAGRFAADLAERVARIRPALVVYDSFAVVGRVVGRRLAVPFVNVCAGHHVHPGRLHELLPSVPVSRPSAGCLEAASSLSDELEIALGDPFAYLCAPSPHLNIYCEPPEFLSEVERAPFEPIEFFGSVDVTPEDGPPPDVSWFPDSPAGARKVYVSFGTVNWRYWPAEAAQALDAIVEDLDGWPGARVLISLGGHQAALGALPGRLARRNVRVADYVDQQSVLRQADVFLTHHGLNSSHEAIYHRVPMLSYPFLWDQPALAVKCRRFGLAMPLVNAVRESLPAGSVRAALERLETDRDDYLRNLEAARGWEDRVIAGREAAIDRLVALM